MPSSCASTSPTRTPLLGSARACGGSSSQRRTRPVSRSSPLRTLSCSGAPSLGEQLAAFLIGGSVEGRTEKWNFAVVPPKRFCTGALLAPAAVQCSTTPWPRGANRPTLPIHRRQHRRRRAFKRPPPLPPSPSPQPRPHAAGRPSHGTGTLRLPPGNPALELVVEPRRAHAQEHPGRGRVHHPPCSARHLPGQLLGRPAAVAVGHHGRTRRGWGVGSLEHVAALEDLLPSGDTVRVDVRLHPWRHGPAAHRPRLGRLREQQALAAPHPVSREKNNTAVERGATGDEGGGHEQPPPAYGGVGRHRAHEARPLRREGERHIAHERYVGQADGGSDREQGLEEDGQR
mmetsp:Transcript_402/g.1310  ORF Transcript_402/g.1310 Transcript_402/m.1310 type:complete len:344 (-) Transcript_402:117-1148(-)